MLAYLGEMAVITTAFISLFLYRRVISALWIAMASLIVLMADKPFLIFLNSAIIAVVLIRAILDRFRNIMILLLLVFIFIKIVVITDYYLNEELIYLYYVVDGLFTMLSVFMVLAYVMRPFRLEKTLWFIVPAVVTSTFASAPVAMSTGILSALLDFKPYLVVPLLLANVVFLLALGDPFFYIPALVFILFYMATYKRLFYISKTPPIGWLYSWLGGRHKVVRLVGVGGFSYVLAVSQGRQLFAAKILRYVDDYNLPLAGDERILKIFGQEMNRYLEIKSDHVVRAYEVYLPVVSYRNVTEYMKNPPYILLELMEGGTLRDLLRLKRRLPVSQAVNIFRQLVRGLYDIHSNNIIHLDIKPENIMFNTDRSVVKIGDMGIAKVVAGGQIKSSFMSPAYAAPEVKRGYATFASDVYSLGCVIYEMLTGLNPNAFVESGYAVPPPSTYNSDVPTWLDEIVLKMLSEDPSKRPTAAQLLNLLDEITSTGRPDGNLY